MDFALIHGGYHGRWVWDPLLGHLDGRAIAVDLPGRGAHPLPLGEVTIDGCADSVAADVAAAGLGPLAVVAHSLGGVVAPAAADRLAGQVEHLVFVSSLVAPDGKCSFDAFPPDLRARADERLRSTGNAVTEIGLEHHRDMLCNDLTDDQTAWVLERLVPDSLNFFTDPVHWGRAVGVPCHYVKLLKDRSLPPPMQDVMIGLLPGGTTVHEIDAGHEVMVSRPDALAKVLREL